MANKTFYPAYNYGFGRVHLEFSFLGNNTSAPLVANVDGVPRGTIATITRSSQGVYVFTLGAKEVYNKVLYAGVNIMGSNTFNHGTVSNITNEASATRLPIAFTTRFFGSSGGTYELPVGERACVRLEFRNTKSGIT